MGKQPQAFEVTRDKEVVRLGSGSGDMKALLPEAIDRGVAALQRFRTIADSTRTVRRSVPFSSPYPSWDFFGVACRWYRATSAITSISRGSNPRRSPFLIK